MPKVARPAQKGSGTMLRQMARNLRNPVISSCCVMAWVKTALAQLATSASSLKRETPNGARQTEAAAPYLTRQQVSRLAPYDLKITCPSSNRPPTSRKSNSTVGLISTSWNKQDDRRLWLTVDSLITTEEVYMENVEVPYQDGHAFGIGVKSATGGRRGLGVVGGVSQIPGASGGSG